VPLPRPEPGLVISYAFLWRREHEAGREEASKDRPCAIVLVSEAGAGMPMVTVVPLTTQPPADVERVLEIPARVREHLGLRADRSWVVLYEFNRFAWPGFDLRPVPGRSGRFDYGLLPPRFFAELIARIQALARQRRPTPVLRD
jgi:hypothetical protein